MDVTVALGT